MRQKGFTLIEILVVLLIISIVTSVALLSIGHNDNKKMQYIANEITEIVTYAEEQAMLQSNVLGVTLSNHDFYFSKLASQNKKNKWIPLDDNILGRHVFPSEVQLSVKIYGAKTDENEEEQKQPQVIISSNGDITPFIIYISKKGQSPRYAVTGDADGNITTQEL